MKYCAQSPMAPRRTDAVLEYWEDSLEKVSMCITPLLHYSATPVLAKCWFQTQD